MYIIGVTGGIGAGKSAVSGILKGLGAHVLDADQISKEVVEPGKPAWEKIAALFGKQGLLPDGKLNRKAIADIVFASKEHKLKLEAIIHEEVVSKMQQSLKLLRSQSSSAIVVLDVPIPVKQGFLDTVDTVWVVVCNDEERINRVMNRSGMSYEDARKRIASQLSQEEYIQLSDVVIENDSSLEDLREKVEKLFYQLIGESIAIQD